MAQNALDQLFETEPDARDLYQKAYGYAVFNATELTALLTAGGGDGVAVNKVTNERTYMNMGTAGMAAGIGGQQYQLVMLFEDEQRFKEYRGSGRHRGTRTRNRYRQPGCA